jgi:hypothetical protein
MDKDFTRFVLYILVLILSLFVCDRIVGKVEDILYSKRNTKLTYAAYSSRQDDIVILGSSRASHHYIPAIISDTTNLSCVNLGVDGQNIYYHFALLNLLLEHRKPKMVIYELFDIDFLHTTDKYSVGQLDQLAPMCGVNPKVDSLIGLKGRKYMAAIRLFDSYRYNSKLFSVIIDSRHIDDRSGYIPIYGEWTGEKESKVNGTNKLDSGKLRCLYDMIDMCKAHDIKIVIVVSPQYLAPYADRQEYLEVGRMCADRGACFLYYQKLLQNASMFKDIAHMNDKGARWYSSIIAREIKQYINE